jgi:hypothetical protein
MGKETTPNILAQMLLRDQRFYRCEIDGLWGKGSNATFADYSRFLRVAT